LTNNRRGNILSKNVEELFLNILGIETTCDETAASIVKDGTHILSNIVATQHEFHREYAGVVPEIASRRHSEVINYVIERALKEAHCDFKELDAVAVAYHPGLIGSLLVGVIAAKTLSYALGIPLVGINHIKAHLYSVHFNNEIEYPVIGLIISGGHTLLITSDKIGEYTILGSTLDDAVGEAFDKVAKHLDLGYPGGPVIEQKAKKGKEDAYGFPCVTLNGKFDRYNFSYSGLKNAVINQRNRFLNEGFDEDVPNIAASFQKAATDVLLIKVLWASEDLGINRVAVAGGVANNSRIREIFKKEKMLNSYFPDSALTQDNAAMVAGLGYHKYIQGEFSDLELEPKSRLEQIIKGKRKVYGS
jgi:N6-L-threonylcarbamoyladenine synthase